MTAKCDLRRDDGFTLIEVLVSLTILAVGLLALALLQTTAIKGNAIAAHSTVATQISQDQLETFRNTPVGAIVPSPAGGYDTGTMTPVYANVVANAGNTVLVKGTTYYRLWFATPTPVLPATLRTVTVWTCWQDERQIWHNVMLTTQFSVVG